MTLFNKGLINKIETAGFVDGPGLRVVIFTQECSLRCIYCHNPETWTKKLGKQMSVNQIMNKIKKYKNYICPRGGITVSGGEPLIQPKFLISLFKHAQKEGIHTALDTSGSGIGNYKKILKYTNLVILDIKGVTNSQTKELTGFSKKESNKFIKELSKSKADVWLRYVVIPGINDTKENIISLKEISKTINNVKKIELLPYHSLGKEKYKELKIKYRLEDTKDLSKSKLEELKKYLI